MKCPWIGITLEYYNLTEYTNIQFMVDSMIETRISNINTPGGLGA